MTGKQKCEKLKELRKQIADKNGIDYQTTECGFEGECKGFCPKCDAELKKLTSDIRKKNLQKGIVGIGIGAIALGLSGCTPIDAVVDEVRSIIDFNPEISGATELETEPETDSELSGDVQIVGMEEYIGDQ